MPSPTITEQADQIKAASADRLPPEVVSAFAKSVAELRAAGVPADVPAPGTEVSDVSLLDVRGDSTSLYAVTGDGPAVVVLYRGAWCPYCNLTLRTYGEQLVGELERRGVALVAVSPQKPDGSLTMQETNDLTFAVVSDPGNALARELGALMPDSEETLAAQRRLGLDVSEVNADGTTSLPMPTVLILDADHRLRWIDVHPDYTTRTEVADILDALDASGAGA